MVLVGASNCNAPSLYPRRYVVLIISKDHELTHDWDIVILWNLDIRRSIILSKPRVHFGPYGPYMFCLDFGFDEKKSEFKVVRVAYFHEDNSAYTVFPPEVDVYSLSTGLLKKIIKEISRRTIEYFYSCVYLNGVTHWVLYIKNEGGYFENRLLVFDLGDERFSEMGLPKRVAHVSPLDLSVTLCRDQISVIQYAKGCNKDKFCDRFVVFGMNQYGEMESCTKKFVLVLGNRISLAIGFRINGEFLIEKCVGHLPSYDPKSKSA
ncbi:hypothetical protein CQW23_02909 [Capsicum baccatum]|uniref:F-box associated beta-propeller type 1 domain-containing protein n=1 Tax=Capsicum baccatum TaxID=33114 RepID=A0A2G2XSS2_CAPBA|nr:hypothetical protein CQW23_02909 [Capsicum baccatum]